MTLEYFNVDLMQCSGFDKWSDNGQVKPKNVAVESDFNVNLN
jgi:hypothetical protein